ncbi:MAG: helix-turn-helix domain-containing protein [Chitinispirillia bacterium]|nr:helix-turn-helix domain-containing protein [Chitinispirillia bacterium]MCL2268416.1 helix-turn-helix domain-containing protein [Chitinispirillia bacterium]
MADSNEKPKPTAPEQQEPSGGSTDAGNAAPKTDAGNTAAPPKTKVGDLLRKERLTRRITIDTIAKDLKLNAGYIKALEASDYNSLPADPYVRVYIKSLTKYLSLDSDTIMEEFYKERGLITEDKLGANKIDVSVKKQEKNPAVIVAASLIVVLAVFAFVANQNGWISTENALEAAAMEHSDTSNAHMEHDAISDEDSVLAIMGNPDSTSIAKRDAAAGTARH